MSIGDQGRFGGLGGLGGQASCGQLGGAFGMSQAQAQAQGMMELRSRQNFIPELPEVKKTKTLIDELQDETDEWLGDL